MVGAEPKHAVQRDKEGAPVELKPEQRAAFHQAEFTAMKSAIMADTSAVNTNFRYAVSLSGGVAAWLLTKQQDAIPSDIVAQVALAVAWWLPLIVSALLGRLSWIIGNRLSARGRYVHRLEGHFRFADLGWERAPERKRSGLLEQQKLNWFVLLFLDAALGIISVIISVYPGRFIKFC